MAWKENKPFLAESVTLVLLFCFSFLAASGLRCGVRDLFFVVAAHKLFVAVLRLLSSYACGFSLSSCGAQAPGRWALWFATGGLSR